MSAENDKLNAVINQIVQDKTYSLEAIEAIKSIKDKRDELLSQVIELNSNVEICEKKVSELKAENKRLDKIVDGIQVREEAVLQRENAAHKAEVEQSADKAKADAYKDALHTVFRPHSVRKDILRAPSATGHYDNQGNYIPSEDVVTSEIKTEQ